MISRYRFLARRFRNIVYSVKNPELRLLDLAMVTRIARYCSGGSGFTKPERYHQYETNRISYAIRLKSNGILRGPASDLAE